ncbi:MAG TPA: dimethylmenaquinone methyltransferase [Lentisphaeria bacterium]|nr:MAG: dimethylmenaquinone methyltransferase [Lentisphaerae bacterium GWF2_49_21]HBC88652.1 dimethylmenaquinone methyltransferase [Lentisphaeria bacterium]
MPITDADFLELKRWNTPTIFNGWEQITKHDVTKVGISLEETRDFMPQMGPMVGRAITVVFEPSNPKHPKNKPNAWSEYRRYVASVPGPKIVVVQDLDKPNFVAAFWGEVNSNMHKALGCVGTITDGCIRDLDEMNNSGLKAIAKRLCVGHGYSCPVKWNCPVEVFGRKIMPGQLIHADKHGFLAIPKEDEERLLDAAKFMDSNECRTMIPAARSSSGLTNDEILGNIDKACAEFSKNAKKKFGRKGEW